MATKARTHGTAATRGSRQTYDRWRGSSAARGYGHQWRKYRAVFLVANPLCAKCALRATLTEAAHVDHIIPVIDKDDPLFWDKSNHQPLCHACHSEKTAKENQLGR